MRVAGLGARPRQPHRRPHRPHRRPRAPDGDRPRHHGRRASAAATPVTLRSATEPEPAVVPLDVDGPRRGVARRGRATSPAWSPSCGRRRASRARSTTTLPIGAGLSSSAALEVAVALALGFDGIAARAGAALPARRAASVGRAVRDHGPARLGGRASRATPCASTARRSRSSPCRSPTTSRWWSSTPASGERWRRAPTPSGRPRARPPRPRSGRSRGATLADLERIDDDGGPPAGSPRRHRERSGSTRFATALGAGDRADAARRDGGQPRQPARRLRGEHARARRPRRRRSTAIDGVIGARLTGAGFGGCVVALVERGRTDRPAQPTLARRGVSRCPRGVVVLATGATSVPTRSYSGRYEGSPTRRARGPKRRAGASACSNREGDLDLGSSLENPHRDRRRGHVPIRVQRPDEVPAGGTRPTTAGGTVGGRSWRAALSLTSGRGAAASSGRTRPG